MLCTTLSLRILSFPLLIRRILGLVQGRRSVGHSFCSFLKNRYEEKVAGLEISVYDVG